MMTALHTEMIYEGGERRETQAITLDNGVKLIFVQWNRGMHVTFRYIDHDIRFDFTATRWDGANAPLNHWEVFLGFALNRIQTIEKITLDVAQKISWNVKNALLHWPASEEEAKVPLQEVKFLMSPWKVWETRADPYLTLVGE